jgi:hypothetical protein
MQLSGSGWGYSNQMCEPPMPFPCEPPSAGPFGPTIFVRSDIFPYTAKSGFVLEKQLASRQSVNVRLHDLYARSHPGAKPGDYACLSVTDSGTGIDPEDA